MSWYGVQKQVSNFVSQRKSSANKGAFRVQFDDQFAVGELEQSSFKG